MAEHDVLPELLQRDLHAVDLRRGEHVPEAEVVGEGGGRRAQGGPGRDEWPSLLPSSVHHRGKSPPGSLASAMLTSTEGEANSSWRVRATDQLPGWDQSSPISQTNGNCLWKFSGIKMAYKLDKLQTDYQNNFARFPGGISWGRGMWGGGARRKMSSTLPETSPKLGEYVA